MYKIKIKNALTVCRLSNWKKPNKIKSNIRLLSSCLKTTVAIQCFVLIKKKDTFYWRQTILFNMKLPFLQIYNE